jgi:hypothetical protein
MDEQKKSRRTFIFKSIGVTAAAAFAGWVGFSKNKRDLNHGEKDTVRMLTQDGKLVEVDRKYVTASLKKINDDELKQWVKK